jgi:hypothetical protein
VLPPARVRTRTSAPSTAAEAQGEEHQERLEYDVGYGKPPVHTRFQPGRSGNPRGRPKGAKGLNTIVRETLTQKVAVRTTAGEKKISRIEAVLQKTVEQAMKGNPRAIAELIKLYGNAVPDEKQTSAGKETEEDLSAADLAILAALRSELSNEGGAQ